MLGIVVAATGLVLMALFVTDATPHRPARRTAAWTGVAVLFALVVRRR
ncbi:hypothetical protein V1227_12185 [Lentzea sp. DG1S-22]|nr:hypothetical protein [Lentzea sp. DG1S-22]WVH83467.1 hypothetical protein V1227_12185 [Lentzea sp. DG1S-22]